MDKKICCSSSCHITASTVIVVNVNGTDGIKESIRTILQSVQSVQSEREREDRQMDRTQTGTPSPPLLPPPTSVHEDPNPSPATLSGSGDRLLAGRTIDAAPNEHQSATVLVMILNFFANVIGTNSFVEIKAPSILGFATNVIDMKPLYRPFVLGSQTWSTYLSVMPDQQLKLIERAANEDETGNNWIFKFQIGNMLKKRPFCWPTPLDEVELSTAIMVATRLFNARGDKNEKGPDEKSLDETLDCQDTTKEAFLDAENYNNVYNKFNLRGKRILQQLKEQFEAQ